MFNREMRDLAHVPRWAIVRTTRTQSVAEHSFFATIYALEIADYIEWPGDRYALLRAALVHDLPEVRTGDIPGPSKRAIVDPAHAGEFDKATMAQLFPYHWPYYKPVDHEARAILDVADRLEAMLFLSDESEMGNMSVGLIDNPDSPYGANWIRLEKAIEVLPCAEIIRRAILAEIQKAMNTKVSKIITD